MKALAKEKLLPAYPDLCAALQRTAKDVLPFAVACLRDSLRAEAVLLETLLECLEHGWVAFSVSEDQELSHQDFREDIFHAIWLKANSDLNEGKSTPNLAYTETSMPFFMLDFEERAALHLRAKGKFSYEQISRIMAVTPSEAEGWVNKARLEILGRDISEPKEDDGGGLSNA